MGYYTDFYMNFSKEIEEKLRAYGEKIDSYEIRELLDNGGSLNAKWYDVKDDIAKLAKENPELSFDIECSGEDGGDLWLMEVRKGKLYIAQGIVAYPEKKLYTPKA